MTRPQYFIFVNALNVALVAPVIAAVWLADTLEWYPWLLLLGVGAVIAAALFKPLSALVRRIGSATARKINLGQALWLAPPLWCLAIGLLANAFLDASPPREHDSEVLRITGGKARRIHLRDFRPGSAELQLAAGTRAVQELAEGQAVTIVTRDGRFGWTRIEAVRPRP